MSKLLSPFCFVCDTPQHDDKSSPQKTNQKSLQSLEVSWQTFDSKAYIDATKVKPGGDAYSRNKFNQVEADKLRVDRDVPDTRHSL